MRIAITGSSGFLGSALTKQLVAAGHDLCLLVRRQSSYNKENVKHCYFYDDLSSKSASIFLNNWKPDIFFHLAWEGVSDRRNDSSAAKRNIELTRSSVRLAYDSGCSKWIGVGSQAEYGIQNKTLKEGDKCFPVTEYGKSKLVAGNEALDICSNNNLNGVWARVFSVYGPGDHHNTLISYIIKCFPSSTVPLLSSGKQLWDFLYITDAAEALISLTNKGVNGIFNVASGSTVQIKTVVEMIAKKMKYFGEIRWDEQNDTDLQLLCGSIDKIRQEAGWNGPVISLEDGIDYIIG